MAETKFILFIIFMGAALVCAVTVQQNKANPVSNLILAMLALFFVAFGFSSKYYTYLIIPGLSMIKNRKKTIVLSNVEPFIFSPSGNAIVVRGEQGVSASAYVNIPVYRSASEMADEEKVELARMFSRILSISKHTVKLSTELYVINKDEHINKIRAKQDEAEERYRKLTETKGAGDKDIDRAKGELTMWRNMLGYVSTARSQALVVYAMVTAVGGNDEEAINLALQRAEELAAGISAVLCITAYVAKGDEVLRFVEPDYMIPFETVSERIRQKSIEEGI